MKRFALFALLMACGREEPRETAGFATSDLSLQIIAETNETGTKLAIGIYARGFTYNRLQLANGESLQAKVVGSAPIVLKQAAGSLPTYEAELGVIDGSIELELQRGNDRVTTVLELPAPFTIEPPTGGISLSKPFTLRWSPATNDSVKLSVQSICVRTVERTLTRDPGAFTWSGADFTGNDQLPCAATIHVRRQGGAVRIAPQLAGVQFFRAEQLRAFGVLASP